MRNYYNLLQIAHMINQLTEKLTKVKQAIIMAQATLKSIWEDVLATLQKETLCPDQIRIEFENCKQLRYWSLFLGGISLINIRDKLYLN